MKLFCFSVIFVFFAVPGFLRAQHKNILISEANNPNEPSIMIDPNNTNRIVAAANLNNYYSSNDGGFTWTANVATSDYGVWGDPVVGVDKTGDFYYFHLSNPPQGNWIDRIVCQKSTDGGLTWSPGTYTGLNGTKAQDKHWAAFDFEKNAIYLTWTQFNRYGSLEPGDSSNILFSRSLDGGMTWSSAKRINQVAGDCIDDDNTVEGAVPCIGPNNEIYVSWAGPEGIVFDKSLDRGDTWLKEDIFVTEMPGGWAYSIPEIQRANGLPVTACDVSGGEHSGTIYINWSDQRNGEDDTDIWL
ncbi:MAG: exo-alpha-sialidase, partial [Calditrichaeota bacterium]